MKKFVSLFIILVSLYSCSVESNEQEVNQDYENLVFTKNQFGIINFKPNTEFDNTRRGKYVGVFGTISEKQLHGKIYVNAGNTNAYEALIVLTNKDKLWFKGVLLENEKVLFKNKRGTFIIDLIDYLNPVVIKIDIDDSKGGYIALKKASSRATPLVLIGTYEETGNEANFFGN